MEIPGQGNLFNPEPEKLELDSGKKSPLNETEYVPPSKETIANARYSLTPEGQQELKTQSWLEAEKKHQRKETEAEAMARAKELEAEGKYEFSKSDWEKVEEEALQRMSIRRAEEIRDYLAKRRESQNQDQTQESDD